MLTRAYSFIMRVAGRKRRTLSQKKIRMNIGIEIGSFFYPDGQNIRKAGNKDNLRWGNSLRARVGRRKHAFLGYNSPQCRFRFFVSQKNGSNTAGNYTLEKRVCAYPPARANYSPIVNYPYFQPFVYFGHLDKKSFQFRFQYSSLSFFEIMSGVCDLPPS